MRFGLFYEHQLPRPWGPDAEGELLTNALEQVELADRVGIDRVWEVEHHFLEEYSHSSAPEVFLAAASQRTQNIRLGHGIVQLPPAVNHPARIAERIATLDLVSGGRVEFGTGEGSSQIELGGFGVPRAAKREQWDEAIDVVTKMLSEEPFAGHRGRWIDVPPRNVVPKPVQRPHPPLWVACSRRDTIEYAARKGIGALSFSFVEPEDAKPWVESYYELLASPECVPAGYAVNPNLAVVVPFMCHPDEETAIERGIDGGHFFGYSLAHYYVFGQHRPGQTNVWDEFEAFRHERGFARDVIRAERKRLDVRILEGAGGSLRGAVGTPDQVADLIARYDEVGVDEVILVAQCGRNRHEHICESLELFGDQVLPRFTEHRGKREAEKADRLHDAIDAALARREPVREAEIAAARNYLVTVAGELRPARVGGGMRVPLVVQARQVVRRAVGPVVQRAVGLVPRPVAEAAVLNPVVGAAIRNGMARNVDPKKIKEQRLAAGFELRGDRRSVAWTIRIDDGTVRASAQIDDDADVVLHLAFADVFDVARGAEDPTDIVFHDRAEAEGDPAQLVTFFSALTAGPQFY